MKPVRFICFSQSQQLQFLELLEDSNIALDNIWLTCLQNVCSVKKLKWISAWYTESFVLNGI